MQWNAALQGLRGLAVTMVLLYHVHRGILTGSFGVSWFDDGLAFDLIELGRLGVDLFFLLSGYLIVGSLVRHGRVDRFLVGRARRIYPAFLVPHLLVFTLGPLVGYAWMQGLTPIEYTGHFLSNLLFLPGVFPLPIAQIVAWSLSYEFVFYLMAASAFAIHGRGRQSFVTAACWGAWLGAAGTLLAHHPRAWFLVAGVLVQRAASNGRLEGRSGFRGSFFVAPLSLLVMLATFDALFPVSVLAGAAFLASLVAGRTGVTRVLERPSLQYLGRVSYSLYLWHSMVLFVTKRLFVAGRFPLAPHWNLALYAAVSVVGSLAAAHVSYVVVERWFTEHFLVRRTTADVLPLPPAGRPATEVGVAA